MRRPAALLASLTVTALVAVTACTGSPTDPTTATTTAVTAPATGGAATSPGSASAGPGAQPAAFAPTQAITVLQDVDTCAQGLQLLADHPYVYPADPAAAPEGGRAWTDVFAEFQGTQYPGCQAVGQFIDAHRDDPSMSAVTAAIAADGRTGWADYFDDGQGVVQQGSRIGTYCPADHLTQFDCEQALVRIGESTAALQNLLALVASAASPSAAAVAEVASQQAEPLDVDAGSDAVTVADPDSDLKGMSISPATDSGADVADVTVGAAATADLPVLPDSVTALSDPFAVEGTAGKTVEVRFPVPDGTDVASVRLYELATVPGRPAPIWSSIGQQMRYEDSDGVTSVVAPVGEFDGVARWGAAGQPPGAESEPTTQGASWLQPTGADAVDRPASLRTTTGTPASGAARTDGVSCSPVVPEKERPYAECRSTLSDRQDLTVQIYDWGGADQRFGGLTKEDVSATVFDTIVWAKEHGLGWNSTTMVTIEDLGNDLAGYVNPSTPESGKTIHLTQRNNDGPKFMTGTVVHELFHAAQGNAGTKSDTAGSTLLAQSGDRPRLGWLIEGTAEWSIDQVYDNKNLLAYSGDPILEAGLNTGLGSGSANSYERGTFFKMISSSCPQFDNKLPSILNADLTEDPTALRNFVDILDTLGCDFGNQLGADRKASLASALAYYSWATQSQGDLALLDANEDSNGVSFAKPTGAFDKWFSTVDDWPAGEKPQFAPFSLPSAGARTIRVPAVSGALPSDKVAELIIGVSRASSGDTSTEPVTVMITSRDSAFRGTTTIGPAQAASSSVTASLPDPGTAWKTTQWTYTAGQSMPELFVTAVNPTVEPRPVRVAFKVTIRDRTPDDPAPGG